MSTKSWDAALSLAVFLLVLSSVILLMPLKVEADSVCAAYCGAGSAVACYGTDYACCYDGMGCVSDQEWDTCPGFVGPIQPCVEEPLEE